MFISVILLSTGSGAYNIANVIGDLEFTIGTGTLGMHNSLRDPFSVKVGEEVDQVEVLQEKRAILANSLRGLGVEYLDIKLGL